MDIKISGYLKELSELLKPLYVVGGYVRDSLQGYFDTDIDLSSPLLPEEVISLLDGSPFHVHLTSNKLFTLKIIRGKEEYEYTTFREDSYKAGHTPIASRAVRDILTDAKRRDFKMNAVYYDIAGQMLIDPLGGISDIEQRVISTTRSAAEVFSEDGLRLMRLVRLSAELGFTPLPEVIRGARENAFRIDEIAPERIRAELDRILLSDRVRRNRDAPFDGLMLLTEIGVTERILPELTLGIGVEQRKDFHRYDVFRHSLETVRASHPSVRLAALFHDIAKPECMKRQGNAHGHDKKGAELTAGIMRRLRYSNGEIARVSRLVNYHMYDLKCQAKEETIRRFIQDNSDILEELYLLKEADHIGGGVSRGENPSVSRMKKVQAEMEKENVPIRIRDLKVKGADLIALGIPPKKRGELLTKLLHECCNNRAYDTYERQVEYIKKHREENQEKGE